MSNIIKIHTYTREKTNNKEKQKQFLITESKPQNQIYIKAQIPISNKANKKNLEGKKNITLIERKKISLTPTETKSKTRHTINCTLTPHNPRYLPSLQSKCPNQFNNQSDIYYRSKTPAKIKYGNTKSIALTSDTSKQRMNCTDNDFLAKDTSLLLNNNIKELQIILSLKKKIKSQNDELQMKIEEIALLNKDKQAINNKELHIENQVLNAEIVKMKKMILVAGNNSDLNQQFELMQNESKLQLEYLGKENGKHKNAIDEMRNQIAMSEDEKSDLKKLIEEMKQKEDKTKERFDNMIKLKEEEQGRALKAIEEEYNNKLKTEKEKYETKESNIKNEYDNKLIIKQDEFKCELNLNLEESNTEIEKLKSIIKELEVKIDDIQRIGNDDKTQYEQLKIENNTLNEEINKREVENKVLVIENDELSKKLESNIINKDKEQINIKADDNIKQEEIEAKADDGKNEDNEVEIPTLMSQEEINEVSYLIRRTIQALQLTYEELIKLIIELPESNIIDSLSKSICLISKSKNEKDYWTLVKYLFSLSLTDNNEISFSKLKKELQISLTTTKFKIIDEIVAIVSNKANVLLSYCQKGDYCNKGLISYEQLCVIIELLFAKDENAKDSIGKIKDYLIYKMKECPIDETSLYNLNYSILQSMISDPQDNQQKQEQKQMFIEDTNAVPNQSTTLNGLIAQENKIEGEQINRTIESTNQMIFFEKQEPNLLIENIQDKNEEEASPQEIVSGIKKYLSDNQISFNSLLLSINSKINIIGASKWLSLQDFALLLKTDQINSNCSDASFESIYLNETKDMLNITAFSFLFANEKDVNIELVEEVPTEEYNIISKERDSIILASKFLDDVFAGAIAREIEMRDERDQQKLRDDNNEQEQVLGQVQGEHIEIQQDQVKDEYNDQNQHQQLNIEEEQQQKLQQIVIENKKEQNEEMQLIQSNEDFKIKDNYESIKQSKVVQNEDHVVELISEEAKDNNKEELVTEQIKQTEVSEFNNEKNNEETKVNNDQIKDQDEDIMRDQPIVPDDDEKKEKEKTIIKTANNFVEDIFNTIIQQQGINEYCIEDKETHKVENENEDLIITKAENGANDKDENAFERMMNMNENGSAFFWESNTEKK